MALNRYQTIKALANFNLLISLGIVPINIMDWIVIYEYYLSERETQKKMQAYSNTAENYKLKERQVMNVVSWMQGS